MNNFGNYEIICEIGHGGMAQVFKAKQNDLKRIVAIKKIKEEFLENENFLKMFKDEAIIAANLNHPNIISIYELGKLGRSYYISMEYVDGESLKKIIEMPKILNEMIPLNISLFIVGEVAKALQFAHRLGVIHRDVSPSNILISYEGRVKLVDFGIAKAKQSISKSTKKGILEGKLNYLAPEQARGEESDNRTDIFSLGIVMYELATGKTLFKGETELEVLEKIRNVKVENIFSDATYIPIELKDIIKKCLQEDREKRYQNITSFIIDLENKIRSNGLISSEEELSSYIVRLFKKGNLGYDCKETQQKSEKILDLDYQTKVTDGTRIIDKHRIKNKNLFFVFTIAGALFISLFVFLKNKQESSNGQIASVESTEASSENRLSYVQKTDSKVESSDIKKSKSQNKNPEPTIKTKEIFPEEISLKNKGEGTIFINVQPSDAFVYIDNVFQGEGNRVLKNLKQGEHIIKITHSDYEDEVRLIKITPEIQKIHLLYRNGEIMEEKNADF